MNNTKSFTQKATMFKEAKQEMEDLLQSLFGDGYEIVIRKKENRTILSKKMYQDFCNRFDIDGTRKGEVVKYRHALSFLLVEEMKQRPSEVGRLIGVDHSTVIHGKQRVANDLNHCPQNIEPCLEELREFLNEWGLEPK